MADTDKTVPDVQWPNLSEVVDGVVPVSEVPQDPNLFEGDDLDAEME